MWCDHGIPYIGFVGWSSSGKTTLLEALIAEFDRRGMRTAVVKHTHHRNLQTDKPGKDSWRFGQAGAVHTALWTPDRVVQTHRCTEPFTLSEVLAGVHDVDLILVEGYKGGSYHKIEVVRADQAASIQEDPLLIPDLDGRVACVTDIPDLPFDGPTYGFDEIGALADFIVDQTRVVTGGE